MTHWGPGAAAAGRVARRNGPAPALAPFPVPGRSSLWTLSCCWGGWLVLLRGGDASPYAFGWRVNRTPLELKTPPVVQKQDQLDAGGKEALEWSLSGIFHHT
jgi:hypothetical protein